MDKMKEGGSECGEGGMDVKEELCIGSTFDGERFHVPHTIDMFESLCCRKYWGVGELMVVSVNAYNFLTLALMRYIPTWYYIAVFMFWRLAYNVGIGYILHHQSNGFGFDRWLRSLRPEWQAVLTKMSMRNLQEEERADLPAAFESWMVFRLIASMILSNDGQMYCILAVKLFQYPVGIDGYLRFFLCFVVGFTLSYLAWHAKMNAHDTVGDFAWFWGDFWFRMEGELTFDGVFELVPHPMYTAGYLGYYGVSLITRSYTLLCVSLIAHAAQILFLIYVEEPHIQKIYGPPQEPKQDQKNRTKMQVVLDWIRDLPMRQVDLSLLTLVLYSLVLGLFVRLSPSLYVLQLLSWRVFHFAGLYTVLYLQCRQQLWTQTLGAYGYSPEDAFLEWQKIFNTSMVMNFVSFVIVSWAAPGSSAPQKWSWIVNDPVRLAGVVGGLTLVAISIVVRMDVIATIGSFGWYYGDAFVPLSSSSRPKYEGMYRFLDNPECLLGFFGEYGVALLARSWLLFWVAVISQSIAYGFVHLVEMPHMKAVYKSVRDAAGIERLVKKKIAEVNDVPSVKKVTDPVVVHTKERYRVLKEKVESQNGILIAKAQEASVKLSSRRKELIEDIRNAIQDLRNHQVAVHARKVMQDAKKPLQKLDEEILELARRVGLLADYIEEEEVARGVFIASDCSVEENKEQVTGEDKKNN